MPTKKYIISFPVDEDLIRRIDNYRRNVEDRIPSRAEACRLLIEESLSKHEKKQHK